MKILFFSDSDIMHYMLITFLVSTGRASSEEINCGVLPEKVFSPDFATTGSDRSTSPWAVSVGKHFNSLYTKYRGNFVAQMVPPLSVYEGFLFLAMKMVKC